MFNTNPKFKATAEAQLHIAKTIEQTCTKSAVSVHVFSKLGDVCVYTGPLNLKSEFPATQSCQLLAFEYCSLKSNKLFKNNVAAHSCSATEVTCLRCRDPRKRLNKSLWLEGKFSKISCLYIHSRILLSRDISLLL